MPAVLAFVLFQFYSTTNFDVCELPGSQEGTGYIKMNQMISALSALDIELDSHEATPFFEKYEDKVHKGITLASFVQVVVDIQLDADSPEQILAAFKELVRVHPTRCTPPHLSAYPTAIPAARVRRQSSVA